MLTREQYDKRYFDGSQCDYQCSAGYGVYIDRGFEGQAKWLVKNYDLKGTLLDVGCAKGFLVGYLRDLGVDAYGLDWSEYAVSSAEDRLKPYLSVGDAVDISDHYDWIISARFMICLEQKGIKKLVKVFNEHSENQLHFIDLTPNDKYYIRKPLEWWAKQGFKKGTAIVGSSWNDQIRV